jgi:hypothetical protein
MNVVELEVRMSIKFTPSSNKLRLMSGILHIPIIISQEQLIRSVMPQMATITCKLGPEA